MDDLGLRPATELVAAMVRGELGSRELLEHYLDRVERLDPAINAVVTVDAERARAEARAADDAIARGTPLGPLHGLPITVKDCLQTAGVRTTVGTADLDHVPTADALAVARLRRAGAVLFGKTNLPAYAADNQTYNDLFGTTCNPWDAARTTGGSSGGSAAAVAAGLTGLELGSDLGGSIRMPAHYCGTYALKPSWGLVPLQGHIPPPPGARAELDIAVVGPLARSADDLDLALGVLAGPDPRRAVAWRLALPPPRAEALDRLRIVAWLDDDACRLDRQVLAVLQSAVAQLREAGARVVEGPGPVELGPSLRLAQQLIQGSVAHALPESDFEALAARAAAAPPDDDSPPVRWARNVTQRARARNLADEERLGLEAAWAEWFREVDVLLCPVVPTAAFPHDHDPDVDARTIVVDGERRSYGDQFAWVQAVGVCRLPVAVVPAGLTADGLPVGLQVVGPSLEDRTAIRAAGLVGQVLGGFRAPPGC